LGVRIPPALPNVGLELDQAMESQNQKWVNLSFLAASIMLGYVVSLVGGRVVAIYDLETRVRNIELYLRIASVVAGIILFVGFYRNEKINRYMNEVVTELSRVTWPSPKETGSATFVVIIMVIISGVILGLLDYCWVQLMKWIL
jgi:preprotein translocase subunit SecE